MDNQSKSSAIVNALYALEAAINNFSAINARVKEGNSPATTDNETLKSPESYTLTEVLNTMPERLHGKAKQIDELANELRTLLF